MRIVFMGTPDFAVDALQALIEAGYQVVAVVTQPDRPRGRGKERQETPVKRCAKEHGIPVFQPLEIKEPKAVEQLWGYGADLIVVAAFGQILSEDILAMPKYGCINIHASLLPKYRGAGPIQWAIIDGEKKTGITIMQMEKGLDTGDMLLQTEVEIEPRETADTLHDKLAAAGAKLLLEAIPKIEAGEIDPVKQDDSKTSYAKMLTKSMGRIDWSMEAEKLDCLIRGVISWPGAATTLRGKTLKIWEGEPVDEGSFAAQTERKEPGVVLAVEKDAFYVQTGSGALKVTAVQPEGKKRMAVKDFLLGYPVKAGEALERV